MLALFWSLYGAGYLTSITFHDIPKDNIRFADTVLGFMLGTLLATIVNWYFGSSKDKEKTNEDSKSTVGTDPENL